MITKAINATFRHLPKLFVALGFWLLALDFFGWLSNGMRLTCGDALAPCLAIACLNWESMDEKSRSKALLALQIIAVIVFVMALITIVHYEHSLPNVPNQIRPL